MLVGTVSDRFSPLPGLFSVRWSQSIWSKVSVLLRTFDFEIWLIAANPADDAVEELIPTPSTGANQAALPHDQNTPASIPKRSLVSSVTLAILGDLGAPVSVLVFGARPKQSCPCQ